MKTADLLRNIQKKRSCEREVQILPWEEIEHTADAGLQIEASSLNQLFQESLYALYDLMFRNTIDNREGGIHTEFEMTALDMEELVVSWLNELLYIYDTELAVLKPDLIEIWMAPPSLRVRGRLFPAPELLSAVKAATYGGLKLETGPHPCLRIYLDL